MKFLVTKSSNWNYESEVNIETIEDLMDFISKNGKVVIFPSGEIEIYDYWRE